MDTTEWYEVYTVVGGALEDSSRAPTHAHAEADAFRLKQELEESEATSWQVFILPHSCDPDDEDAECVCAQFLTDHHPEWSS